MEREERQRYTKGQNSTLEGKCRKENLTSPFHVTRTKAPHHSFQQVPFEDVYRLI